MLGAPTRRRSAAVSEIGGQDLHIPIVTGVSAGAINAALLASHPGPFSETVRDLGEACLD